ncbi:tRNA(fMet)-specific endonuclease VapC [Aquisphaera giovannonii]|uniref:tRNA(fMet)-specific endonuclease VapC n=1 Tax=Aquisphaera giovannonii TaxID=406548 RepID=A0A5B9W4H5_9BACT|nr:type II toxin-antitoxin system VapC family toxin [Aquisphaera giovannonii]QEH35005.1 tRNA(fMet)-specific endonuclease VapC [Aquisphaera giovannonii]
MKFLLDTDICSANLKGHHAVCSRCAQYRGRLYASTVTVGELFTWALRSKAPPNRLADILAFLSEVTVLDLDWAVAWKFAEIRALLFDMGSPPPDMDLVNAATALVHGLTMVTHNTQV